MTKTLPVRMLLVLILVIAGFTAPLPASPGGPPPPTDQPGSCAMMPAGLVGCWSGDNTPLDAATALGGSWEGNPGYATGLHGGAFSFDGQSSVVVPSQPALQFTSAFTLAAWINPSASNDDPWYGGVFSKLGNGGGNYGYAMGISGGNQVVYVAFNAPGQPWPGNHVTVTLPAKLPIGQWAHVAATFDGQDLKLFLNGVVIGTNHTGPTTVATSNNRFRISGDDNNNVRFRGLIDEAAAFNRALSDVEVSGLAEQPLRITAPTSLPNAALGQPYSQSIVAAGGAAPYFFSLASGTLPSGLTLSGDGVISGTTSMPGTYAFTVKVEDQGAHDNARSYVITVLMPGVTPAISVQSDGRFGQGSRYFFDNWGVNYYIHTDACQIYSQYSNYPWEWLAGQPAGRVITQPHGSDVCVLDFTTFQINLGGSQLTIVGSRPLVIATQGDVSVRGNIRVLNNGGAGGVRPEGNYDLGIAGGSSPGSIFANAGGGGWGAAYVFGTSYTPWGWDIMTAASGGGGGSATMGATGGGAHTEYGAVPPPGSPVPGAPGAGGQASTGDVFQGGGGGGQGGYAHTWYCCYTGGVGANGGGALMFQSGGNVLIEANSAIVADGLATPFYQGEVGGGGAGGGGYLLFDAAGTFENRGILSSRGGAGTAYTTVMSGTPGAGGRIAIRHATSALNTGIIDVSGGNETSVLGGEFIPSGVAVSGGGQVKGIGSNVLVGSLTATGDNVIANSNTGTVTFLNVSAMGTTNITPIDAAVARTGGPLPPHYTDTGLAFDVSTTATYTAPVTSCFFAPSIATEALFNRLRVLHLENGAYVDRTILAPNQPAPNFATHTICSSTSSLSPFILALVDDLDTTPPTLTAQDVTVFATDPAGITVDYAVTATDDRGAVTVACSPTSGSTFAIGVSTASCTATDPAGNSATATFTVTVRDGVAPVITAPAVGTVEATSGAGATVTFEPAASDNIGVTSVSCLPASGSTFAIGTTPVTCAARDAEGNTATATFSVTVTDSTAPVLTVPTIVTATIMSGTTVIVNYTATASDVVDGAIAPVCAPETGTAFSLGSTLVSCTAADAHGNAATATFTVKVNDGAAPTVIVAPAGDRTVEATSASGAEVIFSATATDNIDTALAVTCTPASGSTFPLGPTTVTCSATDTAGNTGTASFTVTVADTTSPALTLPAPISVAATDASGAAVSFAATAVDLVDGARTVNCAPASGSVFAPGQTTVTCTAADTRGNTATGTFVVRVTLSDGRLNRFVALSNDSTWLSQGVRVTSGDVGAIQRSGGVTVRLNEGVTMAEAGSRVVGDTVELKNKVSVDNVIDNTLINSGATIRGSVTSSMAVPFVAAPAFPQIAAGTVNVNVAKGKSQILAAGAWGTVHVSQGATLILSGGLYQVQSLDVDPQGIVLFRGATDLRIAGELSAGPKSQLILDQTVAGLKASDMRIYVAGADAMCQHNALTEDGVTYGPAAAHIGPQGVVQANIYAVAGTVWLQSKAQATGAFIGARVRIGQGVTLTLDSGWR